MCVRLGGVVIDGSHTQPVVGQRPRVLMGKALLVRECRSIFHAYMPL
jgi:hypothetical protein